MQENKVTIIGAGVPGLTTAIMLARMGCRVTIVEARTLPKQHADAPTTRTTAIWQGGIKTLKTTGVWRNIEPYATVLTGLRIADDSRFPRGENSIIEQVFKADDIDDDKFGYNIPLLSLLVELGAIARGMENIEIIEGEKIAHDHALICGADLVIGADGRNSMIRDMVGIPVHEKKYDQGVITCVVSHDQSHDNISTEFHRSGGPFTLVPCGERQSAIVWVDDKEKIDKFMRLPRESFVHALQERSRGLLGRLDLLVSPESYPLITLYADRLIADKTVLMAEAAHVMSPIGAQGLNLSLRDVQCLCDSIRNALLLGQEIGNESVLQSYENDRKHDIMVRVKGIDLFHRLVANENPLIAKTRRLGLQALGFISPLREFLIEQGVKKTT